jgi:CHASE2 domain-containing sensor protein
MAQEGSLVRTNQVRALVGLALGGLVGLGVGYTVARLPWPWPLAVALVACLACGYWAIRELLWLRRMRRKLGAIDEKWRARRDLD